jgi:chromosome segregation ATPase
MRNARTFSAFLTAALLALAGASVLAQTQPKGSGNIVCWKDKSGKTVGCGDKVPPEYQDNATREINKRGNTVKQSEPALTPEQKQAQAAEAEQKKNEAQKREEERRRDRALLDSFTNEKEIELKRNRDIQQIEINISAQQTNLKNVTDRQNETRVKIDQLKKENKPVPVTLQEEFSRWDGEKTKIQGQILQKRKEIVERNEEYDAMKKRFLELKGAAATPAAAGTKTATGK